MQTDRLEAANKKLEIPFILLSLQLTGATLEEDIEKVTMDGKKGRNCLGLFSYLFMYSFIFFVLSTWFR